MFDNLKSVTLPSISRYSLSYINKGYKHLATSIALFMVILIFYKTGDKKFPKS